MNRWIWKVKPTSTGKHPGLDPDLCTHSLGKFMGSFRHFLPLIQLRVAAVLEPISPVTGCKMEYRSPMAGLTRRYRHHSRVLTFTQFSIISYANKHHSGRKTEHRWRAHSHGENMKTPAERCKGGRGFKLRTFKPWIKCQKGRQHNARFSAYGVGQVTWKKVTSY